jgi:hypothetical protein
MDSTGELCEAGGGSIPAVEDRGGRTVVAGGGGAVSPTPVQLAAYHCGCRHSSRGLPIDVGDCCVPIVATRNADPYSG